METLGIVLAEHPCLKKIDPKYLKVLVDCAVNVQFEPDQVIYSEGDIVNDFYLIRKGRVALEINVPNKGAIRIETLQDGELLGWSWMIPPCKCQFTAKALERTTAIALDGLFIRQRCAKDHELGYEFYCCIVDVMVNRLQATFMQFLNA